MNRISLYKAALFVTTLFFLNFYSAPLTSQDALLPQLIDNDIFMQSNLSWSPDSNFLVFQKGIFPDTGVETSLPTWFKYDVNTQQITQTHIWPLQPALTEPESELLASEVGEVAFVYLSPDGQFKVFPAARIPNSLYPLVISDRQTNELLTVVESRMVSPFWGPDNFEIMWSDDGKVFVAKSSSLSTLNTFDYVTGYADAVPHPTVASPTIIELNENTYITHDVYDLSHNGDIVLMRVIDRNAYVPHKNVGFRLMLWSPVDPSQSRVLDYGEANDVVGGSFSPTNEDIILIVGSTGLIQYDLITGQSEIINADVNSTWVRKALFSPDGTQIALAESAGSEWNLYVLALPSDFLA